MADVKWIKICTDIFDDEKMLLIESMPEADGIIVIWFKLLCMAGKQNNRGVFMLNDKIAYTDEMLATIFRRPLNTVRLALKTFEIYGMIEIVDNVVTIPKWEKHQNLDALEQAREKNRQKVATYRKKQKLLTVGNCNGYSNGTVTECNSIDKIENKEEEKNRIDYKAIIDCYNDTCVSLQKVQAISDNRKKAIKARLNMYSIEDLKTVFEKAEASDFLKGKNDRNWQANFDWLMKDSNFAKVIDGNYDNNSKKQSSNTSWNPFLESLKEDFENGVF